MKAFLFFILVCLTSGGNFQPPLAGNEPAYRLLATAGHKSLVITIYKNTSFSGGELEILFKAHCQDTKKGETREFFIKKTDGQLRTKTLSNFALIEHTRQGDRLTYPFGWETGKIKPADLTNNCLSIIENKIPPI